MTPTLLLALQQMADLLALQVPAPMAHAIADELRTQADRIRSGCGDALGVRIQRIADRLDEESGANQACDPEDGFLDPAKPLLVVGLPAPMAHAIADELRTQAHRIRSACHNPLGESLEPIADRLHELTQSQRKNHARKKVPLQNRKHRRPHHRGNARGRAAPSAGPHRPQIRRAR